MKNPGKIIHLLLSSLLKKPATMDYPRDKSKMAKGFRGKLEFNSTLCIGCLMCMRDCPSAAIEIRKLGEKLFEAEVNLGKCIYCGQCAESCPKKALAMTGEFELAALDISTLKVNLKSGLKVKPQDLP